MFHDFTHLFVTRLRASIGPSSISNNAVFVLAGSCVGIQRVISRSETNPRGAI